MFGAMIPSTSAWRSSTYSPSRPALIGLISKHGILMVDYADRLQESEGLLAARPSSGPPHSAASHPDDDGGDGGRHGAAARCLGHRRGAPASASAAKWTA